VESGKKFTFREVNGDELVETFVGNPVRAVDEAALGRLRDAIAAEDVEEEQLKGVLRMLGEEIPAERQLPLFGKRRGLSTKRIGARSLTLNAVSSQS